MEQNNNIQTNSNEEFILNENHIFSFNFNLNQIYQIGVALGKLPYETAKPIIDYMQEEVNNEVKKLKEKE